MIYKLYSTEWCCECRSVKQLLNDNGIKYEVVDLDLHPEEADKYNIDSMPILICFKDDKEVDRWDVTKGSVLSWVMYTGDNNEDRRTD